MGLHLKPEWTRLVQEELVSNGLILSFYLIQTTLIALGTLYVALALFGATCNTKQIL